MDIERARSRGGFVVERGRGKKKEKRKNSIDQEEELLSFLFFFSRARIDHHRALFDSNSSSNRATRARAKARLNRDGGARRSCDVFVKRCRLGTKEARLNCAPRGSITGGREVADKRELYKIGCRPRIRREGEGAPYGESGRMPVGHPVGASNAIFHRSRLSSKSTKRSLSLSLLSFALEM